MIRSLFQAIGVLTFTALVLIQYAPGIAGRLGLPVQSRFDCAESYWQLPEYEGWIHCMDLDAHARLLQRGLTAQAAALRVTDPRTGH